MSEDLVPVAFDIDISKPRWDQRTFLGRLKHFAAITDPRLSFTTKKKLEDSKRLVDDFRRGMMPRDATVEQIWKAKHLVQSAYRSGTGELMNVIGRMSFQAPGGMAITGLLLQFYRTPLQVAVMQWLNQSFNVVVNFTNRSATSPKTGKQILFEYITATSTAVTVAVALNRSASRVSPIFARWVPFVAVAAANAVNIPLSRQSEIINGIDVTDVNGNVLGQSGNCAVKGISQVVTSRIVMAAPGMLLLPVIVERIKATKFWTNYRWLRLPFQVFGVGAFLICMVPTACALFPQTCEYEFSKLEPEVQRVIQDKTGREPEFVYFNKGL